jgi:hypothetical protein
MTSKGAKKLHEKSSDTSNPRSTIHLEARETYIKVVGACGTRNNDGIITLEGNEPVWLSLKLTHRSPRYLIGEIEAAGGDFCNEIGYQASLDGKAIGDSGVGFQGGVPFRNLEEALDYLQQYFDVKWCDGDTDSKKSKSARIRGDVTSTGNSGRLSLANSSSLSCVAALLATLLAKQVRSADDFAAFYKDLKECLKKSHFQVPGKDAHTGSAWSDHPGVYVVRKTQAENLHDGILYAGMTGKITREETGMTAKLRFRPLRWDPYRFTEKGFSFKYDRKAGTYGTTVGPANFIVDCFAFDPSGLAAPSFLEAAILQAYALTGTNRLPPANNAF